MKKWNQFLEIYHIIIVATVNGLPQDGGRGVGGTTHGDLTLWSSFDIDKGLLGRKFDSVAILESGEGLGMSGPPSWKYPEVILSFPRVPVLSEQMAERKVRSILMLLKQTIAVFNTHQISVFEVL